MSHDRGRHAAIRNTITSMSTGLTSPLELIQLIDVRGPIVTINGDDEGESDGSFGGSDRDGENRHQHAGGRLWLRTKAPKCDKVQVRGGQHHLDANQDKDGVTPAERG